MVSIPTLALVAIIAGALVIGYLGACWRREKAKNDRLMDLLDCLEDIVPGDMQRAIENAETDGGHTREPAER